eukprot:SM000214S06789  [mRNA]  locus=s214:104013:106132:- [translate_table: standard]
MMRPARLVNDVLGIRTNICDCYGKISNQLLQLCPGINTAVSYIQNCDFSCYFGTTCPFIPTQFALLTGNNVMNLPASNSSANITATPPPATRRRLLQSDDDGAVTMSGRVSLMPLAANASAATPAPAFPLQNATASVVVNFVGGIGTLSKMCYEIRTGPYMEVPTGAGVYQGIKGTSGVLVQKLFSKDSMVSLTGCVYSPLPLMRTIAANPNGYYVQLTSKGYPTGSGRGQLVVNPQLYSIVSSDQEVPPARGSGTGSGFVALRFTTFSVTYNIQASGAVGTLTSAVIGKGKPGQGGNVTITFFGPGTANVSSFNGVTPPLTAVRALLADPRGYYFNGRNKQFPRGVVRGSFTDTILLASALKPENEVGTKPVGVTGVGSFRGRFGGGGVCFTFSYPDTIGNVTEAHIHAAYAGYEGGIKILLYGLGLPIIRSGCVQVDPDVVGVVLTNPKAHYVQVYTVENPAGAIRGQLVVLSG